jgi:hypothetical protein
LILKVARENHYEALKLSQATFGLDSYVERVEKLLTSAGSDASPRYVGVWGMGGVGKTFLLREVRERPKVQAHFQGATFIWLTVGQNPDVLSLYRSITDDMGSKPHEHSNMVDYKQKLGHELSRKRVFLVLDDVWKDENFDALDLCKGEGSVTLLTTRIESILQRPCISQEHMKTLSREDSWSLFRVHAFGTSSSVPHRLEASAKSMAQECGGLPLALKVIGAAMFGKTSDEREWKPLLKKLNESRLQERTMKNELYELLKLGYDVLKEDDPRLEDCFTYFAAFLEDHEVLLRLHRKEGIQKRSENRPHPQYALFHPRPHPEKLNHYSGDCQNLAQRSLEESRDAHLVDPQPRPPGRHMAATHGHLSPLQSLRHQPSRISYPLPTRMPHGPTRLGSLQRDLEGMAGARQPRHLLAVRAPQGSYQQARGRPARPPRVAQGRLHLP